MDTETTTNQSLEKCNCNKNCDKGKCTCHKNKMRTMILVTLILLILAGLLGYWIGTIHSNKSTLAIKTTTTTTMTISSSPTQTPTPTSVEGTASSASININEIDFEKAGYVAIETNAAKKWESDAYLVTHIGAHDIVVTGARSYTHIYASAHTTDYLVYSVGIGGASGNYPNIALVPTIETQDDLSKGNIIGSQLPLNTVLTETEASSWPKSLQEDNPNDLIQFGGDDGKGEESVTINGQQFYADNEINQTNNSKKIGLFYDVIFTNTSKLVAFATFSSNGKLISFKKY